MVCFIGKIFFITPYSVQSLISHPCPPPHPISLPPTPQPHTPTSYLTGIVIPPRQRLLSEAPASFSHLLHYYHYTTDLPRIHERPSVVDGDVKADVGQEDLVVGEASRYGFDGDGVSACRLGQPRHWTRDLQWTERRWALKGDPQRWGSLAYQRRK